MHRQDRKCPCAAILITEISVCDNRLGISRQWFYVRNPPASGRVIAKRGLAKALYYHVNTWRDDIRATLPDKPVQR